MNIFRTLPFRAALSLIAISASANSLAVDAIMVGDVIIDSPTNCCLGFAVPVSEDDNYNAVANIEFRETGTESWTNGLPLLRVRPELTSEESPPSAYGLPVPVDQFAGSVFGLVSDTEYEVRISVIDPDGGNRIQTVLATTRRLPPSDPATPNFVAVTNSFELSNAISSAQPGDVIELAPGTYDGPITISADGTLANPIIIRGASADTVTIDARGASYGVSLLGRHNYLEYVTIEGSTWGARSYGTEGTVIRYTHIRSVQRGIDARSGTNLNFYICDNILEGPHAWPKVDSSTWNDEGIAVTGEGHTVCFNTLSGFGDALGLGNNTAIPNRAIDFFGNDVLWTGDDGIELDFAHRNVRAFENRVTNAAMGASLQPVWGGPVYIFRNVFLNLAASAYKLNNDPNGFYIYHNTSARSLGPGNWGAYAWTSLGYTQADGDPAYAGNFEMKNNILFGLSAPAFVTTDLIFADIDYNGWSPDGAFRFVDTWVNFADLQPNSPYEDNGLVLDSNTFSAQLVLPADYTSFWAGVDITLGENSLAIDRALPLPNINDGHNGNAPDLGAVEYGKALPTYGARETAPPLFDDVPEDYWARSFIETLATSGITAGCDENNYCPEDRVPRAQMAVFLERGMKGSDYVPPEATGDVFLDVFASDFAANFIEQLYADRITAGCGNNNYCPRDAVSRAQMAVFLLRAKYGAGYSPPAAMGVFNDVDLSHWAVHWIEKLAAEGITTGCGNGNYCPEAAVTRAQMAVFLVRTFGL